MMNIYSERRTLFAELLTEAFGARIDFGIPEGGLAFWVKFTGEVDVDRLVQAADAQGLAILSGNAFTSPGSAPVRATRLGFARMDLAELTRGTRLLREALACLGA
jgi:GntR family transcriptional regulator/MocR family aminotransferase